MNQFQCSSAPKDGHYETLKPLQLAIIAEISETFQLMGAEKEVGLFAALHSWGDTMPEEAVLEMMRDYNAYLREKCLVSPVNIQLRQEHGQCMSEKAHG